MKHHGLSSTEGLPTDWTAAGPGIVVLVEVSVQSLGEGGSQVTEVTLPGLVVLVISVHVVHHSLSPRHWRPHSLQILNFLLLSIMTSGELDNSFLRSPTVTQSELDLL